MRDMSDYSITNLWSSEKRERIMNSNLVNAWTTERINYQERYADLFLKNKRYPEDQECKGAMHEARYVLISIFGLTEKQVSEVEKNLGITDSDWGCE